MKDESPAADSLDEQRQQHAADIIYTYMVKDAPQGVQSVEKLINNLLPELESELKTSLVSHKATLCQLASQIAVPLPNVPGSRLFAVELESQEHTTLRNQLAGLLLTSAKGVQKSEVLTALSDFEKAQIEPMLKQVA